VGGVLLVSVITRWPTSNKAQTVKGDCIACNVPLESWVEVFRSS
jgi:hypothetical protein